MVAIKTADLTQDFRRVADMVVAGEIVLVSRPKNDNLVVITEKEYNELDKLRKSISAGLDKYKTTDEARARLRANLRAMQEQSYVDGTDEMTIEEVTQIVAEVRSEYRNRP